MRCIKIKITYVYNVYVGKRKNTFIIRVLQPRNYHLYIYVCVLNCLISDAFYRNTDIDRQNVIHTNYIQRYGFKSIELHWLSRFGGIHTILTVVYLLN